MDSSPLHLLFLLGYCLALIEGELRCHCNESGCVATGYMCKSRAGQCFTALEARGEVTHLTHGCLDSLPEERRALCQKLMDPASSPPATPTHTDGGPTANAQHSQEKVSSEKAPSAEQSFQKGVDVSRSSSLGEAPNDSGGKSSKTEVGSSSSSLSAGVHHHHHQPQMQHHAQNPSAPVLLCCTEHMCNYREDADITVNLMPKFNSTYQRGRLSRGDDGSVYARDHHLARRRDEDADRDLWFKAAVIAVPIAGGFILVLLVLLAVRMLRSDSTRHRRLIQIRRERSLTKAQMYISEHFMGGASSSTGIKNKLHQCPLFDEKLRPPRETCSVYSEKVSPSSGNSSRSGNLSGSAASTGSGENSNKALTSGGNIIRMGNVASDGNVGYNSRGMHSSAVCCTDQLPCCGGLCTVQRATQIRHCETCNNRRRSRTSCNCNCCCNKVCHTDCAISSRSPNSIGDIQTSIPSCSISTEGINNPIHPLPLPNPGANHGASLHESYPVHQTPCSFSPGLHSNHAADFASRDINSMGFAISAQHNPAQNIGDRSFGTSYPQSQQQLQHSQSQQNKPRQYRALVAHWDKTNSQVPTAVV